jgi:RNA polymerase sigma-70 factor, ECF subfamily
MIAPRRTAASGAPSGVHGVVLPMAFSGDDVALVAALREKHPGAQSEFFDRYAAHVERLVTHVLGFDRELADVLQDVFVSALRSLHTLEDPGALRQWLSRIAMHTARKVIRTRTRRRWLRLFTGPEDEKRWEPPAQGLDEDVLRAVRAVYEVLDELPADDRIVFSLRFVEGMDLPEVANACGVSLSTIKRRLQRAQRLFSAAAAGRAELSERLRGGTRWQKT